MSIAEAMVGGLFCQECGVVVDGDEPGYPRTCGGCLGDESFEPFDPYAPGGPLSDEPEEPSA